MTRCRNIALAATFVLAACVLLVSAADAGAVSPKAKLRQARVQLAAARAELTDVKAALRVAIDTGDKATQAALAPRYRRVQQHIRALRKQVRRLHLVVFRPMTPGANGSWWRVIKAASLDHHLDPRALHRMMMLESGGNPRCVSGPFCGLFQYCSSAWNGSWNPYRHYGVFHGGAQIWATAKAIRSGWGPQMWPNAYPMAFGR